MKSEQTNASNDSDAVKTTRAVDARPRRRFWVRAAIFFFVAVLLAVGASALYLRQFWRPIEPDEATPERLVGWLALRDLSVETPETREKLFDKYFAEVSTTNANGETRVEAPDALLKIAPAIFNGRDAQIDDWDKKRTRPPYWRIDYVVVPKTPRTSEYVVSSDIQPGPSTLARWNARRKAAAESGDASVKIPTRIEKNVRLLVFQWFVKRYREYDATPDVDKGKRLETIADELRSLQDFYNGLRDSARLPPKTRAEALKEFESTIDGWFDLATPSELAKALWFKDLIVGVAIDLESPVGRNRSDGDGFIGSDESNGSSGLAAIDARRFVADVRRAYPPRVPTAREPFERADEGAAFARFAFDAFRRFAFVDADSFAFPSFGGKASGVAPRTPAERAPAPTVGDASSDAASASGSAPNDKARPSGGALGAPSLDDETGPEDDDSIEFDR